MSAVAQPPAAGSPPSATPPSVDRRTQNLVFATVALGLLLAALDQTIVSTALPTIVADLHGASHLSWVVTAYLLASTASTPLWGKLGDLYGRKRFFQAAIVVFLIGSVLAGLSQSMIELIAFRAVQGLGGGGLIVGAQAIVGDVVAPRDRGRYQGLFGAVFGVATVVGPLLGGFFTEQLSWRWVFYVNLPFGVAALVVTAAVLPSVTTRVHHVIDYLGALLLAGAATAFVLLTSTGGTTYAWGSAPIVAMGVIGVVLLGLFIVAEHRAEEPILPLHLFRIRAFSVASVVGFVIGFAMYGAITFLPLFIQDVRGVSPTQSGLEILPLMGGLLVTSIVSGRLISRWGRYKVFPVAGSFVTALGLWLLHYTTGGTSTLVLSLYMVVLGAGLGAVMQVLVLAAQNAVPRNELGVATSGATFFRSIGGSFGTAIFGAIFSNVITGKLAHDLAGVKLPAGLNSTSVAPAVLDRLPEVIRTGYRAAFSSSLDTVFLVAAPIGLLAFLLSLALPEIRLRRDGEGDAGSDRPLPALDADDGRAMADSVAAPADPATLTQT